MPEWPEPWLVEEIVDKSSCQFVYASIVINFISAAHLHPVHQLETIRGLRSEGDSVTPFPQLDALYRHILSQVHDITRVTAILAVVVLSGLPYRYHLCEMLDIIDDDIDVALGDLTSIISNNRLGSRRRKTPFSGDDDADIRFLHASLPDFLLDQSRSQQYFIDKGLWCAQLAVSYLNKKLVGMLVPWFTSLNDLILYIYMQRFVRSCHTSQSGQLYPSIARGSLYVSPSRLLKLGYK